MDILFESQYEGEKVSLKDLMNGKPTVLVLLRHLG